MSVGAAQAYGCLADLCPQAFEGSHRFGFFRTVIKRSAHQKLSAGVPSPGCHVSVAYVSSQACRAVATWPKLEMEPVLDNLK
jgi:hypothetical protein